VNGTEQGRVRRRRERERRTCMIGGWTEKVRVC